MLLKRATRRNISRALKEINAFEMEGDFKAHARHALKEILEKRLEVEMTEYLGLAPYEHAADRLDYRNGSYVRHLLLNLTQHPESTMSPFFPTMKLLAARCAVSRSNRHVAQQAAGNLPAMIKTTVRQPCDGGGLSSPYGDHARCGEGWPDRSGVRNP